MMSLHSLSTSSSCRSKRYGYGALIVLVFSIIALPLIYQVFKTQPLPSITLDVLETNMLKSHYSGTYARIQWLHESGWNASVLRAGRSGSPQLVLIHGYGTTSSMAWRKLIPRLANDYDIIAINLPGFGRVPLANYIASGSNQEAALQYYCEYFKFVWTLLNLHSPIVVAHSFGGFLFTHCLSRDSSLSSFLILSGAPGFFSVNGGFDYYHATIFAFGLPHSLLKAVGHIGKYAVVALGALLGTSDLTEFWYALQMSELMRGHEVITQFVKHHISYAMGTHLSLIPFLSLSCPVALVYGSQDTIAPVHQGRLLQELVGVNVYEIDGAHHMPYSHNDGIDFAEALVQAISERSVIDSSAIRLAECLQSYRDDWTNYPCLPIPFLSDYSRQHMYIALRKIRNECFGNELPLLEK